MIPWTAVVDGAPFALDIEPGESLLSVMRERLHLISVKDGCAPQGQCGCCTVLIDGEARVACVTPAARALDREITTVNGLPPDARDRMVAEFCATGASQCGFCTPGIVVRLAALAARSPNAGRVEVDRALAAHLCRCTGWQTIHEAFASYVTNTIGAPAAPDATPEAARRAELEGGVAQRVGAETVCGRGGFADDTAPTDCVVAIPQPPGSAADSVTAAGHAWVTGESLTAARTTAGKIQGRRTTMAVSPPLPLRTPPADGVALATSWVEPAYLEPDASWCAPGGTPASPLANGGAFGAKQSSLAPQAARELADALGRPVRVVFAREDAVRFGAKRPPIAATAVVRGHTVHIDGEIVGATAPPTAPTPYALDVVARWSTRALAGPTPSLASRAAGWAEQAVLVEGAVAAADLDRAGLVASAAARAVLLDTCVVAPSGALAGVAIELDDRDLIERIVVRVDAGEPLDGVTLRSYCIGAVHQALGWVLTEGLTVDPATGEIHDLTIRSFGIIRPRDVPAVDVEIVDSPEPPRAGASDAVFAATAAALWNTITKVEGARPASFPALQTTWSKRFRR